MFASGNDDDSYDSTWDQFQEAYDADGHKRYSDDDSDSYRFSNDDDDDDSYDSTWDRFHDAYMADGYERYSDDESDSYKYNKRPYRDESTHENVVEPPPLDPTVPFNITVPGNTDIFEPSHDTQPSATVQQEVPDREPKRVEFMWREWVYDETGVSHIEYSKWTDMFTKTTAYFKETRYGARMDPAQLESHRKFKLAQASHQALLRLVEEKFNRQRKRSQVKLGPTAHQARHSPIKGASLDIVSPEPTPEDQHSPPQTLHSAEGILSFASTNKVPRDFHRKSHHRKIKRLVHFDSKYQASTNHVAMPTNSWLQATKGVKALHSFQSSYLLPLPWQHHAWIAPAHRKTLRQQPFLSRF
jgi:hypothetical protein